MRVRITIEQTIVVETEGIINMRAKSSIEKIVGNKGTQIDRIMIGDWVQQEMKPQRLITVEELK